MILYYEVGSSIMEKIKVLQILDTIGIGGTEMFAMNLYRTIDAEKFHIDFVVFDKYKMDYYDEVTTNGSSVYFF